MLLLEISNSGCRRGYLYEIIHHTGWAYKIFRATLDQAETRTSVGRNRRHDPKQYTSPHRLTCLLAMASDDTQNGAPR
jgi:hypothetical protein